MKLPPREKWFQYILGFSALFVASIAAFFSVMGIGMLFSGAVISSMVMASSLELGKIVAISFLYRYWKKTTKFLKIYLTAAVAILVIITSLGVFGWLSSAYQSSALKYEMSQQQVATMVEQKGTIEKQAKSSQQRIDSLLKIRNDQENRMNEALSSPILSRNPTALRQVQEQNISLIKSTDEDMKTEKASYNQFIKESMEMDKKIMEEKTTNNKTKDIITFKFVADAFGWELNSTVKWFILLIIVVFDPLAVCLILAYNVILSSDKKEESVVEEIPKEDPTKEEPKEEPVTEVSPTRILLNEVPVLVEEIPQTQATKPIEVLPAGLRHSDILHYSQPVPHRL